jgi:hypothetical protein
MSKLIYLDSISLDNIYLKKHKSNTRFKQDSRNITKKNSKDSAFPIASEEKQCGFKQYIDHFVFQSNILIILSFNALSNCLGYKDRVVFLRESKYHLSIDRDNLVNLYFFICSEITSSPLKAKKIGLLSRGFCVFLTLFAQLNDNNTLKSSKVLAL